MATKGNISGFFGLDDDYVRPVPTHPWRTDWIISAILVLISCAMVMYMREIYPDPPQLPGSFVAIITAGILLTFRRRFPVTIMFLGSGAHFIIVGVTEPLVASTASMQVLYFLGIYTAVAYARRRDTMLLALGAVLLAMLAWLIWTNVYWVSLGSQVAPPTPWYYVSTVVLNVAFFGGAIFLGQQAWLQAKSAAELDKSRETVHAQSKQLAEQAVLAERLRIARDLHDSVAHHISLIGVQTAAARRAMSARPELAAEAMREVEGMSRDAVAELRSMLGSLREISDPGGPKTVEALSSLAEDSSGDGLVVTYQLVGEPEAADHLTPMQASTLIRIAQEALTNVRRHSTATEARMVLRLATSIELEITDNGRSVPNTAGSGLGQIGIRERVTALGGTAEIGPRATLGYRVLVRLPTKETS